MLSREKMAKFDAYRELGDESLQRITLAGMPQATAANSFFALIDIGM